MHALRQRRCWVFDLDGTLTVAQHDFDAIRAALDIPRGHFILEYLETLPPAEAAPLHRRLDDIETELAGTACPADGAHDLLRFLHARGAPLGILTRNTRRTALATLRAAGLDGYFDPQWVLGRDDAPPKPAPDGITRLLQDWGHEASAGVMVGDVGLDLEAGRAAGVATVHVMASRTQRWPDFTDYACRTLDELLALVSR